MTEAGRRRSSRNRWELILQAAGHRLRDVRVPDRCARCDRPATGSRIDVRVESRQLRIVEGLGDFLWIVALGVIGAGIGSGFRWATPLLAAAAVYLIRRAAAQSCSAVPVPYCSECHGKWYPAHVLHIGAGLAVVVLLALILGQKSTEAERLPELSGLAILFFLVARLVSEKVEKRFAVPVRLLLKGNDVRIRIEKSRFGERLLEENPDLVILKKPVS